GVLEGLGSRSEELLYAVGGFFAVDCPQIADTAKVEVRVRLGRQLQHLPMAEGPVSTSDLGDLNPIVRAHNTAVSPRRERQNGRTGGSEKTPAGDFVHGSLHPYLDQYVTIARREARARRRAGIGAYLAAVFSAPVISATFPSRRITVTLSAPTLY